MTDAHVERMWKYMEKIAMAEELVRIIINDHNFCYFLTNLRQIGIPMSCADGEEESAGFCFKFIL